MAPDPLLVLSFTVVPLVALGGGVVVSAWYARRVDRRLVVGTALLALMGAHQLTEGWALLTGATPHATVPGELFETSVNLLAVASILVLARRLETERRRLERQALVTRELAGGPVPGADRVDSDPAVGGVFGPAAFELPILGRLFAWAFESLPLGTTANLSAVIETVSRNLQVTYPVATVDREAVPDIAVFAEATTLEDVLETVLKQLVVYNDSSEPTIHVAVETDGSRVRIRVRDNGPGLPEAVAAQLTGRETDSERADLELGTVRALLENWGGSIGVADGTVELTLLRPRS
jgi:hypothetical protein